MDQALPHDALGLVKTHGMAMDIASVLEADSRTNFQVLAGFFRFFDAPAWRLMKSTMADCGIRIIPTLRTRCDSVCHTC